MEMAPRLRRGIHTRHVAVCEDGKHAGRPFSSGDIDRRGSSVRNRAVDNCPVSKVRYWNVGRVTRRAGDLEPPVDTGKRLSDGAHARAPAVSSARKTARCASSTLKVL